MGQATMSTKPSITRLRHLDMLKTALGSVIDDALTDRNVIEVMVNPDGRVWLDVLGKGGAIRVKG